MTFTGPALTDLDDRIAYESWLLEEIYRITDQPIPVLHVDELVYPPSGASPSQTIYASGSIEIGNWRPGFLAAGAPLILVTAFKLIDMILEWILAQNGHSATFRFVQKIQALRSGVTFPELIACRPWLQTRLVFLYEHLEPLRGTIIHNRHFTTADGAVTVANTKTGAPPTPIPISAKDLNVLSALGVSIGRYLLGAWTLDQFRERRVRFWLDQLAHVHRQPSLGQLEPGFLNVRTYAASDSVVEVDLNRLRRDVTAKRPNQDPMFDIRLVTVEKDGSSANAFLIPWSRHETELSPLRIDREELTTMECPLPDGIDVACVARDLARRKDAGAGSG